MRKATVIAMLEKFPKEFELDELFEHLVVANKIDEGLENEKNGSVVSHDKVKKEIKKWQK